MGRLGIIAAVVLCVMGTRVRAGESPEQFAKDEIRYYTEQMQVHGRMVDVSVDPKMGPGEAVSVESDDRHIKIVASNGFMALAGAYQFLDAEGCRFLSPHFVFYGDAFEVVPKVDALTAQKFERKPALKFRKLYVEEGHSHTPDNLAQLIEWMPKVGFNTLVVPADYQGQGKVKWDNFRERVTPECQKRGITIEVGGHGYQNFLNAEMEDGKLFEQHPEWFGMDVAGKRHPEQQHVFCSSNPAAVDYLIKNFIAYVKDRQEIQIYDFWPPDGAKWCECDACKKLGSAADREAILVGEVQKRVKEVRPDLRLEFIAYQLAITPPEHAKVDKSVLIDFCPIDQQFDHAINDPAAEKNKNYADALLAWRKAFDGDISIYSYYRKYAWDSLPVILPHYMQKDLQWYGGVPVQGISSYSEPADWGTYELNHYVLAALGWDVNVDVDAVVKKFCDARFEKASGLAQSVFAILEKVMPKDSSIPNTPLKSADEIADAKKQVDAVLEKVAGANFEAGDKPVGLSLKRLGLMCTYASQDLEIQHLRATGATKDQVTAKADELQQFIAKHADDGVFLVKDQRISPERMQKRYGNTATTKN